MHDYLSNLKTHFYYEVKATDKDVQNELFVPSQPDQIRVRNFLYQNFHSRPHQPHLTRESQTKILRKRSGRRGTLLSQDKQVMMTCSLWAAITKA